MPARATKRSPAADIPPDVYVAIARDPDHFDTQLAEWDKRRNQAVEAEAIAQVRIGEAERAEDRSRGQLERLEAQGREITTAQNELDARTADVEAREVAAEARDGELTTRAGDLDQREARIGELRDAALAPIRELVQ